MTISVRMGIDVGSTTTKVVVIDGSGRVIDSLIEAGEPRVGDQAVRMVKTVRDRIDGAETAPVVATGYGRKLVPGASRVVTEISCHARGAFHLMKRAGVLIDVGGQDTKVIRIGKNGEVDDFAMNDKCAAGTGRFLEVILPRLGVSWSQVGAMFERAQETVSISSTCTVFAESEVISLLANGQSVEGVVKGLHAALTDRVAGLAARLVGATNEVFLSGGVANNAAMVSALTSRLRKKIEVVPEPQLVGALGAALSAR